LLFKVISIFVSSLLHLTDTILQSYPFKLYCAFCVVLVVLVNTRRSYFPRHVANNQRRESRNGRYWNWVRYWGPATLLALSFASFFLQWATSAGGVGKRGYEFAFANRLTFQTGSAKGYEIDPGVFSEIRFQVWIAIFFLILCGLHAALRRRTGGRIADMVRVARKAAAFFVLFLAVNYLMYMALLQYESMTVTPWNDLIPTIGPSIGPSMMAYDPAYGFWIFLACSSALVWISLRGSKTQT
jgi:hypothetical protein